MRPRRPGLSDSCYGMSMLIAFGVTSSAVGSLTSSTPGAGSTAVGRPKKLSNRRVICPLKAGFHAGHQSEYILYISGEYRPVKVVPQPGSSAGLITQLERLFLEEC